MLPIIWKRMSKVMHMRPVVDAVFRAARLLRES